MAGNASTDNVSLKIFLKNQINSKLSYNLKFLLIFKGIFISHYILCLFVKVIWQSNAWNVDDFTEESEYEFKSIYISAMNQRSLHNLRALNYLSIAWHSL